MKTKVVWRVEKLPRRFATFIESTNSTEYYTLGDFPGLIAYYKNEKILEFFDSRSLDKDVVRIVTTIISLWVGCLPHQLNINGENLT